MTFPRVRRILADLLGVSEDQIAPGTRLARANGVDAICMAKLVIRCEQAFRVTIRDEHVAGFEHVADLADYINERIADGRDDYRLPNDANREAWYYE